VNSSFSHSASYAYDSVNRLATAAATGNSTYNLTFSYDRYGNMTYTINGNTNGLCPQYSFNSATNQINTSGYTYDAAGNLINDGTHSYQWDAEGRLSSIDNGSTEAYTYNALDEQAEDTWNNKAGQNERVFDRRGRLMSYWNTGSGVWGFRRMLLGGRTIAYDNGGVQERFEHANLLGSVSMVTYYDGSLVTDQLFYPWGALWQGGWGEDPGFAGMLGDEYTGNLWLAQFRHLSMNEGRWLSPDPGEAGADSANPQTWNAYAYTGNNPTTNTDPSGEDYEVCVNSDNGDPQCTHIQNEALVQAVLANPGTGITVKGSESSGTIYGTDANGNQVEVGTYTQVAGPGSEAMASGGVSDASAPLVGFVAAGIGLIRSIGAEVFGSFFESQAPEAPVAAESGTGEVTGGFDQWNKIHHVFDNPGHGLGPLVEQYGSKEAAYNELQRAASEQLLPKGITGVFNEQVVSVGGTDITVSGRVMNGVVNIGTAFRPGFRP